MASRFKRINWRLLALHFLGMPFLVLGAQQLALIRYVGVMKLHLRYGRDAWQHLSLLERQGIPMLIVELQLFNAVAALTAILTACMLSGLIAWRREESRLFPLLLFVGHFLLGCTHIYDTAVVKAFLGFLRGPFKGENIKYRLALAGSTFIIIGLLLFLSTWRQQRTALSRSSYLGSEA